MRVTVRYYGIIGDLMARQGDALETPDGTTVGDLMARLAGEHAALARVAKQVRPVVNGQNAPRDQALREGDEVALMRAIGGGGGARIVHDELPIVPSPSGLPTQHIIGERVGATSLFVGQQWLRPGDRVYLHTHPCEEALTFLSGSGEATLGDEVVPIGAGTSLFISTGLVHGFRNTGSETLHVLVVFPVPYFAETIMVEPIEERRPGD